MNETSQYISKKYNPTNRNDTASVVGQFGGTDACGGRRGNVEFLCDTGVLRQSTVRK
ncbi:hypothetical protein EMU01_29850 [Enterococcus mundtii]|uniref:Uncharacterized protein n=1 Tax=Enterococcus mundtii TaxID=53346 RepID=A0ABQ0VGY6_ENTMU|nr:hypothetical protein EMU01_29850 [Enterococcus mundtii]GEN18499.1 hypothetical protein LAC02_17800 [Ligilactobacillus acidipiscis]